MKYTDKNPPIQCFMRQSSWYKGAGTVPVRGVLWHSTGANNPWLKRYVQPDDNAPDKAKMLEMLGKNKNGNDWNHISRQAGVHAWIGKLASGEITTIQVGPWDKKAWGCASGPKGSCDNGWIQFEICEDALADRAYFDKVYREAVELTAYLCKLYGLNPKGTVSYNGVTVPVILCHQDSYQLKLGSNHGDVYHWFKKYGKTMDDVRNDVAALLGQTTAPAVPSTKPAAEALYRVQVGAYKQKPNADAMLAKLKAAGFEGFTTKVGELYKVQVGAYKDSVKAENFRQTVKQAGFPAMVVKALTGPQEGPQEGFKPYRVQVHTPVLNVRQEASTGAVKVGSVRQGEVLTIVEESTGPGAKLWGKVENKNGWISLDFVKKV